MIPLNIKGRIHKVHILLVQLLPQQLNRFSKALEMNDLPFPQEFDHIIYIRIIGKPQDIVIGHPGFLLWHIGIKTTNIRRNIRNKRLIVTKYKYFLLYTLL